MHGYFPSRYVQEVVEEGDQNISCGGDLLLPADLVVVVFCAGLRQHHGAGYRAGHMNPVMSCYNNYC